MKRKDRKSDGVHGENKESIRRSGSGIKESIGENKITSR